MSPLVDAEPIGYSSVDGSTIPKHFYLPFSIGIAVGKDLKEEALP